MTWLVIASPYNRIEAKKECFPFMGCFPYLGFFKKSSADEHIKKLQEEDYVTYVRPVYAFSTLGYFTDTILSSFFYYKEFELAELVFHELFHTIFFPKNEVDLNENLANYFGRELAYEYFKTSHNEIKKQREKREKRAIINQEVSGLAKKLNKLYKGTSGLTKESSNRILKKFMDDVFRPQIEAKCTELNIPLNGCSALKTKWNNATLASYLTYEKNLNSIELLRERKKLSLKEFFQFIHGQYRKYLDKSPNISFSKFLLGEVKNEL